MSNEAQPSVTDRSMETLSWLAQSAAMEQQRFAALTSNVTSEIAGQLASLYGRGSVSELSRSPNFGDRAAAEAMRTASMAVAEWAGWSPVPIVAAAQNVLSGGGMQLVDSTGRNSMPLYAYGPASAQLSGQLWNNIESQFFHAGGAINLSRTYGGSRQDIADVLSEGQRLGVFQNDIAGTYEPMTAKTRSAMRDQAMRAGDTGALQELESIADGELFVRPSAQLVDKTNNWIKNALKNVAELRSMLGNFPVQELYGELERLTGMDIGQPGAMTRAVQDLRSRVNTGAVVGMNAQQTLSFNAATASTFDAMMAARTGDPIGAYADTAGRISGLIDRQAAMAFKDQEAGGGRRTMPEIATGLAGGVSALMVESPEVVEAMFAASAFGPDSAARKSLMGAVEAFGSAGTVEEREMAKRQMATLMEQTYGARSGFLTNNIGMDRMLSAIPDDILKAGTSALLRTDQAAMVGDFNLLARGMHESNPFLNALGGAGNVAGLAQGVFQGLSSVQRNNLSAAFAAGDMAAVQSITNGVVLPGLGAAGDVLMQAHRNISNGTSGRMGFHDFMGYMHSQIQAMGSMGGLVSPDGRLQFERKEHDMAMAALTTKGQVQVGVTQGLEQGMFGGEMPLEDKALLTYGESLGDGSITRLKLSADGIQASASEAKALAQAMAAGEGGVSLYSLLGVSKGDDKALASALQRPGSSAVVAQYMRSNPDMLAGLSLDKDGNSQLVYGDRGKLKGAHDKEVRSLQDPAAAERTAQQEAARNARATIPFTINVTWPGGMTIPLTATATGTLPK